MWEHGCKLLFIYSVRWVYSCNHYSYSTKHDMRCFLDGELVPYSVKCQDHPNFEPVTVFKTQDPARVCLISQDPIAESCVEFCPNATLIFPYEAYNGIRLSCGHEFHAVSLIWYWALNYMVCPCCRRGRHPEHCADIACNIHKDCAADFETRKDEIVKREKQDQSIQDEMGVLHEWADVQLDVPIHSPFNIYIALFFINETGSSYNMVISLHRHIHFNNIRQRHERFNMQHSDMRNISRRLRGTSVTELRFVVFLNNTVETHIVAHSAAIDVTGLGVARDAAAAGAAAAGAAGGDNENETGRDHTRRVATERVSALRSISVLDDPENAAHVLALSTPASVAAGTQPGIQPQAVDVTTAENTQQFSAVVPEPHTAVYSVRHDNVRFGSHFIELDVTTSSDIGLFRINLERSVARNTLNSISEFQWIPTRAQFDRAYSVLMPRMYRNVFVSVSI